MSDEKSNGRPRKFWQILRSPSASYSIGTLVVAGFVVGILFWGGFNWAMELSNSETFCISCHEMEVNVYQEYRDTIHYNNSTGIRAVCADCHVPKDWSHKIIRKIFALNELFHFFVGTVNTPEKFEAKRLELAQHVWRTMKSTNSRECRNCHDYDSMDYVAQQRRSVKAHIKGFDKGETCIDCHKGIAHSLPAMYTEDMSVVTGN